MAKSFPTQSVLRSWLVKNHATAKELLLRCYKIHARRHGIGYKEGLDEALCFGWIDGVRRSLDADSFSVRFTPRRPQSKWSKANIKRARELQATGRMHAAGLAAFRARGATAPAPYDVEYRSLALDAPTARKLRGCRRAHRFFEAQPPGYRRLCIFWVMTAKREKTRARRLATLIDYCERGTRILPFGKIRFADRRQ
jgi:uncharacterized protein YdeI (YjbR/CyaY-like superfamily)